MDENKHLLDISRDLGVIILKIGLFLLGLLKEYKKYRSKLSIRDLKKKKGDERK